MSGNNASLRVLKKYVPSREGEEVIVSIEGDAYNFSPGTIMRILGILEKFIALITGSKSKVYIYVTNRRIISIQINKKFWVIDYSIRARSYLPRAITGIGYTLIRDMLIFKNHYLEFSSGDTTYLVKSNNGKTKVYETIDAINALADETSVKKN